MVVSFERIFCTGDESSHNVTENTPFCLNYLEKIFYDEYFNK